MVVEKRSCGEKNILKNSNKKEKWLSGYSVRL